MKILPSYPKCDYRITISNGLSHWCSHPIRVSEHIIMPHCWGACEYLEYDEKDEIVLANPDVPFWFHSVMYLPRYKMFVSFQSFEFFEDVTRDEAIFILRHVPFLYSIRTIIFIGVTYRAAQDTMKRVISRW